MNRIILIGNGFDKGVGLPTLYSDFMNWLIDDILKNINKKIPDDFNNYQKIHDHIYNKISKNNNSIDYTDDFVFCHTIDFPEIDKSLFYERLNKGNNYKIFNSKLQYNDMNIKRTSTYNSLIQLNNIILSALIEDHNTNKNWGNIEQIFYDTLIKTSENEIKKLNKDFSIIINKLEEYLKTIDIEKIIKSKSEDYIEYIKEYIYSEIFPVSLFCPDFIKQYMNDLRRINSDNKDYSNEELNKFINSVLNKDKDLGKIDKFFKIYNYLFLNFNYTNTPKFFFNKEKTNVHMNIHGNLMDDSKDPIIFGFGDELDKNYIFLEDKNNNDYLKHIKSINYLQNGNYRKLIEFIEADHFQVLILGHSCGVSDRTLLNTIFEHDNCVSIMPFIRTDEDNYQDTIMNIYRNFIDKRKLRKRVVNKKLCKKLTLN